MISPFREGFIFTKLRTFWENKALTNLIRTPIQLDLIWVQSVCKVYQQTTKLLPSKKSFKNMALQANNYNCHNIYWDQLIWLVKNGNLIVLTCISFFVMYSWGAGTFTAKLLLWYCALLLWREMDSRQLLTLYLTLTQIFSDKLTQDALINSIHAEQLSNAILPPSLFFY